MVPRALSYIVGSFWLALFIRLIMIGAKRGEHIQGWRKVMARLMTKVCCRFGLLVMSFAWISNKDEDIDYSPWLGPDWKSGRPTGRPPIIVSNHQSWSVC